MVDKDQNAAFGRQQCVEADFRGTHGTSFCWVAMGGVERSARFETEVGSGQTEMLAQDLQQRHVFRAINAHIASVYVDCWH